MQMKQARSTITTAALIAFAIFAPAGMLLLIVYWVSRSETISSVIFLGSLLADLYGVLWWISKGSAPSGQRTQTSVHEFVAHMKMHPELMPPGMTEFDLERFRKLQWRGRQPGLDAWLRQFRGETTTHPSGQFR